MCACVNDACNNGGVPLAVVEDLKLPGRLAGRGCLVADVRGATDLRVACLHLSLGQVDQTLQLSAIARLVADPRPWAVMGDFNGFQFEPSLQLLEQGGLLTNLTYNYANLKTKYGINFIKATVSSVDTVNGWVYGKLNNTGSNILLNGTPFNRLILAAGISFDYSPSNFTLNVPGTVYGNPYDAIPHAWQAGPQTTLLANQLKAMPSKGVVLLTIPKTPYRCPPGPYERACLLADWLKVRKPRAKLLVLDANLDFVTEKDNFSAAFFGLHADVIEYRNNVVIESVDAPSMTLYTNTGAVTADVINLKIGRAHV